MNIEKYLVKGPENEWPGLTLDELRYARAITLSLIHISEPTRP